MGCYDFSFRSVHQQGSVPALISIISGLMLPPQSCLQKTSAGLKLQHAFNLNLNINDVNKDYNLPV